MKSSWARVLKWITTVCWYVDFKEEEMWDNSEKNYLLTLVSGMLNTKKICTEPLLNEGCLTATPHLKHKIKY